MWVVWVFFGVSVCDAFGFSIQLSPPPPFFPSSYWYFARVRAYR